MAPTMSRNKSVLTSLVVLPVLLCAAPAVASAAPDSSAAYLSSLNKHGINYSDPHHMVSIGTTLCQELRNGRRGLALELLDCTHIYVLKVILHEALWLTLGAHPKPRKPGNCRRSALSSFCEPTMHQTTFKLRLMIGN